MHARNPETARQTIQTSYYDFHHETETPTKITGKNEKLPNFEKQKIRFKGEFSKRKKKVRSQSLFFVLASQTFK